MPFRASTEAGSPSAQANLVINVPAGVLDDDHLVLFGVTADGDDGGFDALTGWTEIRDAAVFLTGGSAPSPPGMSIWIRRASSEPASYTITPTFGNTGICAKMIAFSDGDLSVILDVTETIATGDGTNANPPTNNSASGTDGFEVIVAAFWDSAGGDFTAVPTGYTDPNGLGDVVGLGGGNGCSLAIAYRTTPVDPAAAEDPAAFSSNAEQWGAVTISLRPMTEGISDVDPNEFDMDAPDVDVNGEGFEAAQAGGTVYLSDADTLAGSANEVNITSAVNTWSDILINLDLTLLSASELADLHTLGPGPRFVIVLTDGAAEFGSPGETLHRPQAWVMSASASIAAGGENTTNRLTAPAGKSGTDFVAGRIADDENPDQAVNIPEDDFTEMAKSIEAKTLARTGLPYRFKWVGSLHGDPDTFSVHPTITVSAGAAVSQTAGAIYEALAGLDQTVVEHHEALGFVDVTIAAIHEALAGLDTAVTVNWEALGDALAAVTTNHEALESVLQIADPVHEARGFLTATVAGHYEALAELSQTALVVYEALEGVERVVVGQHEALAGVLQAVLVVHEAIGQVVAASVIRWEALAAVVETVVGIYESQAGVPRTVTAPWEALAEVDGTDTVNWEAVAEAIQTVDANHEAVAGLLQAVVAGWEALGFVPATADANHEALAGLLQTVITNWEALGAAAVSQAVTVSYEALGGVVITVVGHHESAGPASATVVGHHEALEGLTRTVTGVHEALARVEVIVVGNHEALAEAIQAVVAQHEARGHVTAVVVGSWEALAEVLESTLGHHEAVAEVLQTVVSDWEALGRVSAIVVAQHEAEGTPQLAVNKVIVTVLLNSVARGEVVLSRETVVEVALSDATIIEVEL